MNHEELQKQYNLTEQQAFDVSAFMIETNQEAEELAQAAIDDGAPLAIRVGEEEYVNVEWLRHTLSMGALNPANADESGSISHPHALASLELLVLTLLAAPIFIDRTESVV